LGVVRQQFKYHRQPRNDIFQPDMISGELPSDKSNGFSCRKKPAGSLVSPFPCVGMPFNPCLRDIP
jgi:hypothetical protein